MLQPLLRIGRRSVLIPTVLPFLLMTGCTDSEHAPIAAPSEEFSIGVNVAESSYFATEVPFLNLFKLADPWVTQCDGQSDPTCGSAPFARDGASAWDTREQDKLDLDAEGYPLRLPDPRELLASGIHFTSVATLLPTGLTQSNPSGRFIVAYDGEGTIEYGRGATRNADLSKPGRDVIDVRTDGIQTWIQLAIRATDRQGNGNHIRNVRVVPEGGVCANDRFAYCRDSANVQACRDGATCRGFEDPSVQAGLFDPRFLSNLRPFSTVRFMGFQNTNNAGTVQWSQRTLPGQATYVSEHGDGAPIEAIAELGNQLGADIWVNMPTRADDDYVREFAALIKQQLRSDLRVYVEYSNEAWNDAFAAGQWIQQRGEARWPGGATTPFDKRLQWFGMRTAQICDIWEHVWADEAGRIVCVMGAQAANAWTGAQALDCPLWAAENGGKPCYAHHVDAVAIAPYFGFYIGSPEHADTLRSWAALPDRGLINLFAEIFRGGQLAGSPPGGALRQARGFVEGTLKEAQKRHLRLLGYEGGQHLVGVGALSDDQAVAEMFIAANRDRQMAAAYQAHLSDWHESGGGLYNLWNSVGPYSRWGSWGLLEHRDQHHSMKYDAAVRFIDETRPIPDRRP